MDGHGLRRDIRFVQYFNLAFGTIVGVGWIIIMSTWLLEGGALGASLAFLVAGVFMSAIGLCYAKLAIRYPVTGGSIAYAYNVFGGKTSFLVGWLMVLTYVAASAFGVVSTSWVIEALLPGIKGPALYQVMGTTVHLGTMVVGLLLLLAIGYVNYRGTGLTARFQDALTYIFLLLGTVIVAGAIYNGRIDNLWPLFKSPDWSVSLAGFLSVLATTPFFLSGFDVVPQAMGEKHPSVTSRQVMVAVVGAIMLAMIFYISVILGTAMLLPRGQFAGLELVVAEAFTLSLGSPVFGKIVLVCGLFGVLSSWNALFFAGTRVLFALGRAQFLPAALARLSRHGTPSISILLVALTGVAVIFFGKGIILPLVKTHVTVISSVFFVMALSVHVLQSRGQVVFASPMFGRLVSTSAMIFAGALVTIALNDAYRSRVGLVPLEWVTLSIWCVLGAVAWALGGAWRDGLPESRRAEILLHG